MLVEKWLSCAGGQIPGHEVFVELRKYEEFRHLLFDQSIAQAEAIGTIKVSRIWERCTSPICSPSDMYVTRLQGLVDNAVEYSSTLTSASFAVMPVEKFHASFLRYDEMRVACERLIEVCHPYRILYDTS